MITSTISSLEPDKPVSSTSGTVSITSWSSFASLVNVLSGILPESVTITIGNSEKLISLIENKKSKSFYVFSEPQVQAILDLRLQKLTALGINEIESEIKRLSELIIKYKKIISSKKELQKVISEELKNIKDKNII